MKQVILYVLSIIFLLIIIVIHCWINQHDILVYTLFFILMVVIVRTMNVVFYKIQERASKGY